MIHAFLFDLDGTLVDTHQANYEAYKRALQEQGVSIDWDAFKATIGLQSATFLPMLAPDLSDEVYTDVRASKAIHYKDVAHLTQLNVPLVTFVDAMKAHHKIGIVTTAQRESAEHILKTHDLLSKFDVIVTANDVQKHKPDPEGYNLALSKLGVAARNALAFEDSETGIEAARAAGLQVVRINDFIV